MNFRFNEEAFRNTVAQMQSPASGDNHTILIAAIDRQTRPVRARFGSDWAGKKIEWATVRPIVSAGWDANHKKKIYVISGVQRLDLNEPGWMLSSWLDDVDRRTKAFLPDGMPYPVRSFLLEGHQTIHRLATPRIYSWLSGLYGKLSCNPGDAAELESVWLQENSWPLGVAA